MRAVTRRANSVWTFEATGDASAEERIDHAEAWYASRNLPPAFQVTDRSCPDGLDAALEQRGYLIDAPVSIQVATTTAVLAATSSRDTVVTRACPDAWFNISAHGGRFANVAGTYRDLLQRIGPAARFALASLDGQPAAVGLGVVGQGWMGIFSMLTLPSARRRGAANSVLAALAATAQAEAIESLYLQVERADTPATTLYARASFRKLYGYHYRVAPTAARRPAASQTPK
jgi:ribosomal protein S18 acetylase RimI-like enzyme